MRMPEGRNDQIVRYRRNTPAVSVVPLLDISAVAEVLGASRRHVQRLVSEKRIPYFKVGRLIRFDASELSVWLEERRVEMHVPPNWLERDGR
jgi:excisionase family DNA binding protein